MGNMKGEQWNFSTHGGLFQATTGTAGSDLNIVRLAPGEGYVEWEWRYDGDEAQSAGKVFVADVRLRGEQEWPRTIELDRSAGVTKVDGLENGVDYELRLRAVEQGASAGGGASAEASAISVSPIRLVRPGHVPGTVINYIHPEDYTFNFSGRSPASPSIAELPDGRWVASHDVYWGKGGQNLSFVFRSEDQGKTWAYVTALSPCFWGKLFVHRGSLYMLATSTEYGDLLIGRSEDGGETWSAPTKIIAGGSREEGGPHKAPMPVISHNGRLWSAVEYGSWSLGGHSAGIVSVPEDADLLDAASWTATPFLAYDSAWPGTVVGGEKPGVLEGNAVVRPDGRLVNILRYNTRGGTPNYGRAIVLSVNAEEPGAALQFDRVIDFHGNMSKFSIRYDAASGRYWSLVNRVNSSNVNQRNILTLVSSADTVNWKIHCDILNYEDNGWPEDSKKVGFQYVDWMFQGDDLAVASRTAINGAYNHHNANYLTYHRVERFREQ